ncbi:MAG: DNA-deoxyinosine glycosylase [Chitinophagales bacterium]|nr:DNA-deoxyinosine glycosylase [Chitinophagales bacterium]
MLTNSKNNPIKKTSFPPISNENTRILILGSLPGDKSLELGEYYGHPRNRFWKILSTITNKEMPVTYAEKKEFLLKSGIGVWDVAHKATRNGSMDSAMKDEEPNDLEAFIANHKNLTAIGFNGKKAELLFNKFFKRQSGLRYISLPSSSPANAGINFEDICAAWKLMLV